MKGGTARTNPKRGDPEIGVPGTEGTARAKAFAANCAKILTDGALDVLNRLAEHQ